MGRVRLSVLAAVAAGCLGCAGVATANPIFLPTLAKEISQQKSIVAAHQNLNPPAPPCPESGMLPAPFSNCGLPEAPATTLPYPGNMAYWNGHVQTTPKEYIVFWGWGDSGAWPSGETCPSPQTITEGSTSTNAPLCDPEGLGKYMADFVAQMGGTDWANVSTQYYQTDSSGNKQYITNPTNVLAGMWVDNNDGASSLPGTSGSAPAGPGNTYYDLAAESQRAIKYFGITDLNNANIIIAQPYNFSDPNAVKTGYCAFHDWTDPRVPANSYYLGPDITQTFSYTNMPDPLAINSNGVNVCGEYAVNNNPSDPNPATSGKLDGASIVLGHEIEETITDPGAEDIVGNATTGSQIYEGGWYDAADANENGDKCAWVGENLLTAQGPPAPIYGAMGDIKGNAGTTFAVQALWSNASNEGTGYCAGAGTDSPVPSAAYGSTAATGSGAGSNGTGGSSSGGTSTNSSSSSSNSSSGPIVSFSPTWKTSGATKAATHKKRQTRRHHKRRTRRRTHK